MLGNAAIHTCGLRPLTELSPEARREVAFNLQNRASAAPGALRVPAVAGTWRVTTIQPRSQDTKDPSTGAETRSMTSSCRHGWIARRLLWVLAAAKEPMTPLQMKMVLEWSR